MIVNKTTYDERRVKRLSFPLNKSKSFGVKSIPEGMDTFDQI